MSVHEDANGGEGALVVARVHHMRVRLVEGEEEHVVGVRELEQRHPMQHRFEGILVARCVGVRGAVLGVCLEALEVLLLTRRLQARPRPIRLEVLQRAAQPELLGPLQGVVECAYCGDPSGWRDA